jgi:hypothetical protein
MRCSAQGIDSVNPIWSTASDLQATTGLEPGLSLILAKMETAGQSCHDPINGNLWLLVWSSAAHFLEERY